MKHWWQYDSDEGRIKYIKWVRKINEYPNYYIDYEFEAEAVENLSLQGKIAYFKGEMRKLIAGGIRRALWLGVGSKMISVKYFRMLKKRS